MTYTDPDFSTIRSRAAGKGSSARVTDTAGQVSTTSSKVAGVTDGKGSEKLTGDASEIGKTLSALATDAAISTEIWGDLNKAADAWTANAPKAEEMNTAEKAVSDAQAACTAANEKADAAPDNQDLQRAADDAGEALVKAKQALIDLQRKRKAANKALLESISRAIAKAKRITGGRTQHGTGKEMPGTGTSTETGTGSGNPAARTTGTDKPSGTPAANPSGGKPPETPTTTTSSTSGLTPTEAAALVAAAQGQQNQQQPQAQQAAAQPIAQMPTMPQVPQQQNQQQNKGATAEKPLGDKIAEAALGQTPSQVLASLGSTPTPSSSTPSTPAPAAQNGTVLRGPDAKIAGVGLGGAPAVNTQNPVTSGTSATGLTTPSDVAGRSTPTPGAFDSPKTATSAAHAESASQRAGETQQQGRPVTGGGMPMAPGMLGAPGGAASASRQAGDGDRDRGVASNSDPLGLMHERGDAVEGGTIAQNRDKPAA